MRIESSLGNCKLIFIVVTLLDLKTKLTSYIAHLNFYTRANILRFPKWLEFMGLSVSNVTLLTCARFWGKTINPDFAATSKPLVVDQPSLGTVNSPFLTIGNSALRLFEEEHKPLQFIVYSRMETSFTTRAGVDVLPPAGCSYV